MKKLIYLLLIISVTGWSCASKKSWHFDTYKGNTIVTGKVDADVLKHEKLGRWFTKNYYTYHPDDSIINILKTKMRDVKIDIYMGTWCPDSREHVPAFMKILDESGFDESKVNIYALPGNFKEDKKIIELQIIRVPTFIIKKTGKETGRIIEYPMESLEKDLLDILNGNYKHELENN
jgi:thiol-disulfide isomerase/thioredoxin